MLLGLLSVGTGILVVRGLPWFGASPSRDAGGGNVGPGSITQALQPIFAGDCPRASQASNAVAKTLGDLGYSGWSVESHSGITPDGCANVSIDTEKHQVILMPALSGVVKSALQELRDNSYDSCFTELQVAEMLTTALTRLGLSDFTITRDGRLVAPTDRFGDVRVTFCRVAGCTHPLGSPRTAIASSSSSGHRRGRTPSLVAPTGSDNSTQARSARRSPTTCGAAIP